ncbi:hypothetical protein ACFFU1_07900 [Algibacter miyuki]|uniref:Uncharacterized protein n=1 Tax=Algibacter miyuki TaxID=1306933 RepID=A0ABV5GZ31_9FLAO|nr:hypothetical protein [Algibacter miyuki]MDN3666985.1 hypothetical protein [Algibacter miyuki]
MQQPLININQTHLNKILFALIFTFFFSNTYSQEGYIKLPFTKGNCPTIIIEKNIIANESVTETKKEWISEISVVKDKVNRKDHKFFNLTENGIIFVRLNKKVAFKTQNELNAFFGIKENNSVYVNGYLIEHPDYKIATESIMEIELIEPDSDNKLKSKAINVWTLTKQERINGCHKQNVN